MDKKQDKATGIGELRRQAERRLLKKQPDNPAIEEHSDTHRLLHELQVHQIELEIQNEELLSSRRIIETALEQYTDLYDFAPVGYLTLGRDGAILRANLNGARLLGLERSQLLKQRLGLYVLEGFRSVFADFLEKVFSSREKVTCELAMEKKENDPLWVRLEAISEDGDFCRAALMDISERKEADKKLKQFSEQLEQLVDERTQELREAQKQLILSEKLAALGQLAGGVGHELRNPLGVINNAIYFLKEIQQNADDKVIQYLNMIEKEVNNAEKIVKDLLDFARGTPSVDREWGSVPELVKNVLIQYPAPPSVEVTVNVAGDLPKYYADRRQMSQVLGNLVVNAYQAMPNGGQLTIISERSQDKDSPFVLISIMDNGKGIAPEHMQRLFEPLFTTKPKGIGLGLATSKKYVEANAGRIEVQSEPGKGSNFTVYLPTNNEQS